MLEERKGKGLWEFVYLYKKEIPMWIEQLFYCSKDYQQLLFEQST